MIDKSLVFKIGLGGIVDGHLMTFDFRAGEKLKPYVCAMIGRDFKYGFKREFAEKEYLNFFIKPYDKSMQAIRFKIEECMVYEYKRFAGASYGEVDEGYFVVVKDKIIELEYEEVRHWCGTAKEKMNAKTKGREIFGDPAKKYVSDDVDF
jgi:hypothetical protein